jgi:RimJ/RimL family protein N-acetyltransferase
VHELALSDGRRVWLRPIRPDDKGRLAAGLEALSPLSRYRRFLSPKPRLSSAELRYLTEVDGRDHVALVALAANAPECLVAVGRFVRLPEAPDTAEFAIVVADDWQARGLGRALAERLAAEALRRDVRRFRALTLEDNVPVQRLIARLARHLEDDRRSGGVRETVADLAA